MNNGNSLEDRVKEAVERCKGRKCEGCPFNGISACCVTILLHIQHATATFEKDGHHLRCSNCGEYFCGKDCEGNVFPQKYCPNCGAKMEEGGGEGWSERVDQINAHRAESICDGSHRANGNPENGCVQSVSTDGMRVLKETYSVS